MTEQILEALAKLDVENDEQWTADGLPRTEVVAQLAGVNNVTRKQITEADAELTRDALREAGSYTPPGADTDSEEDSDSELEGKEAFDARIAEKQAEIDELTADIDEAQKAKVELQKELVELQNERNAEFPPMTQAEATRAFVESQARQREERVAKKAAMNELLGSDSGKSALDEAMARKTGHGKQRPQFGKNG